MQYRVPRRTKGRRIVWILPVNKLLKGVVGPIGFSLSADSNQPKSVFEALCLCGGELFILIQGLIYVIIRLEAEK